MTRLPEPISCGKVFVRFHRTKNRMRADVYVDGSEVLRPRAGSYQTLKVMLLAQLGELTRDLQLAETAVRNLK